MVASQIQIRILRLRSKTQPLSRFHYLIQGSSSAALAAAWIDEASYNNEHVHLPTTGDLKGSGVVLSEDETCSAAGQAPTRRRLRRGVQRWDSTQGESCGTTRKLLRDPLRISFGHRLLESEEGLPLLRIYEEGFAVSAPDRIWPDVFMTILLCAMPGIEAVRRVS